MSDDQPTDGAPAEPGYSLVYIGREASERAAYWHGPICPPGTRFPLPPGRRLTLGRGTTADVPCFSNGVARLHVIATLEGDVLHFEDAQSTNGTWKDGVSVDRGTLRAGERISVAGVFIFELQRD